MNSRVTVGIVAGVVVALFLLLNALFTVHRGLTYGLSRKSSVLVNPIVFT